MLVGRVPPGRFWHSRGPAPLVDPLEHDSEDEEEEEELWQVGAGGLTGVGAAEGLCMPWGFACSTVPHAC
jgi:hypothetical protein